MALPKVFDYTAESDEEIVTKGVQGFEIQWVGMNITKRIIHIVVNEGVLAADGQSIETITRGGQQITLEGQDVLDFYALNNAAIDALATAAMDKWALDNDKTGAIIA